MIFNEVKKDLFSVEGYYLVHTTSANFDLSRGSGVEFDKKFNLKSILKEKFKDTKGFYKNPKDGGYIGCVQTDNIFTLIIKENSWQPKTSYFDLEKALKMLKEVCIEQNIKKLAMPLLGCGVNCLDWRQVSKMIQDVFNDMDIEILACRKGEAYASKNGSVYKTHRFN